MQYILSQEEYDALKAKQKHELSLERKNLQELCTKIANEMPVDRDWSEDKEPWGCILTEEGVGYCDDCPVQTICPYSYKEYSK